MRYIRILFIVAGIIPFAQSCKDSEPEPPDLPEFAVMVNMNHTFGTAALALNDRYYVTANQDSFQPTKMIYHINNFVFIDENDEEVTAPTQWFMVDLDDPASFVFDMGKLESKTFKGVRFTLGVADSTASADGVLNSLFTDPMYWGMINGYINFKLEGRSPQVDNETVILHLGGYSGDYKINHTYELDFGIDRLRSEIGENKLTLDLNLAEYFANPNTISLDTVNLIHQPNDKALMIAQNWGSMITYGGIR